MPDLVCEPSIIPAPASGNQGTLANDGWFPDIDLTTLRAEVRVVEAVSAERFRAAVRAAVLKVGGDRAVNLWRAAHVTAGKAKLVDVSAEQLDGLNRLELLYLRAIGCFAKAELVERYRDFDRTGDGQREVEDLSASIGELRRDAAHALRDLLGRPRTNIELL